jgi:hypothetical protein
MAKSISPTFAIFLPYFGSKYYTAHPVLKWNSAHKFLLYNVSQIPRSLKAYSNQVSIVQSSGTGMSCKQANLMFTPDPTKGPVFHALYDML